ncbi:unnamed protein product, partial [Prorocentrum cordatum]
GRSNQQGDKAERSRFSATGRARAAPRGRARAGRARGGGRREAEPRREGEEGLDGAARRREGASDPDQIHPGPRTGAQCSPAEPEDAFADSWAGGGLDQDRSRCVTVHGTLRNESLQASAHTAPLLGIGHCIPGAVARPAAAFALVTLAELFLLAFVLWSNPRRAWRSSSSSHAFRVASPTP